MEKHKKSPNKEQDGEQKFLELLQRIKSFE